MIESARAGRLLEEGVPFVAATVVRAVKPTSVRPGDSAIVHPDGTIEGFVGGQCAESSVRLYAARALETGEAILLALTPGDGDDEHREGVIVSHNPCLSGGTLEIFLEPQLPPSRLVVVGDTPIARALRTMAGAGGYEVSDELRAGDAALVVASHGHGEEAALTQALETGVGYVGLVASARRGAAVLASLDLDEALRARVHTPAGLDIGARAASEIAISILAEVVAERAAHPVLPKTESGTAIDPVCGMEVDTGPGAITADVGSERFYFCRDDCRSAFVASRA